MNESVKTVVQDQERHLYQRQKLIILSCAFFFTIGGYTLIKELKDAIFVGIVGADYLPLAKQLTLFVLIPFVFLYAKLVDKLRRYQLLYVYSLVYGLLGLLMAVLIGNHSIGIANTDTGPYRIFGWLLYFFFEGYSPFVVSVFWAFANSINSPDEARRDYALMISASKLGGLITAGLAWFLFTWKNSTGNSIFSEVATHQLLLGLASSLLLCIPIAVYFLMKKVPGRYLHGYEAVYKVEKEKKEKGQEKTGILAGLVMLIKYPYVMGIFGMIFFYEVVNVVLNYQRIVLVQSVTETLGGLTGVLFKHIFFMHAVGLCISYFGTRALIKKFGERWCLILIPVVAGVLLTFFMINVALNYAILSIPDALAVVYVALRSVNYGFSFPLRESLYIPTVKEVKFKSKSWIDSSGSKLAKASGSMFNQFAGFVARPGSSMFTSVYSIFFAVVVGAWTLVAYLLGKRFEWAIAHNEVIGVNGDEDDEAQK